jgi:polar amino acid transport system substrate-binding protein
MSFLLITLLVLALIVGCSAPAQAPATKDTPQQEQPKKVLNMAINATFPPFESVQVDDKGNQKFVGIDMDIADHIAQKLNVEFKITDMAFNGLVTAVSSGRADIVISGISPTDERLQVIDFSEPYFLPANGILSLKDSVFDTLESLEGKKSGVRGQLMQTSYFVKGASGRNGTYALVDRNCQPSC